MSVNRLEPVLRKSGAGNLWKPKFQPPQKIKPFCFKGFLNPKWWRRRESNKRLRLQPIKIQIIFFRYPSPDSVWIVSSLEFAAPNSDGDINPGTGTTGLH